MPKAYKEGDPTAPPFGADYDVLQQVVLNLTDIGGNNNKFYSMELQKCDGCYRIFTHYGRVGVTGTKECRHISAGDVKLKDGEDLEEAIAALAEKEFSSLMRSKQRKGYVQVDMEVADVGSFKAQSGVQTTNCSLDSRVAALVEQVYQEASETLEAQIRTPLGALSETQIQRGFQTLEQIRHAVDYGDDTSIVDLSSVFYSLIPQRFPGRIDPSKAVIDSQDKADRQEELLQLMLDVCGVKDDLASGTYAKYRAIGATVDPLDPASEEYRRIEDMVYDTESRNHSVSLQVNSIFSVEVHSTRGRYNPRSLSSRELFHGSANRNILGILQRGLLIAPPCAHHTGSAFGRGIYFARHSTKSAQYSTKFYSNIHENGFLFIADVALGRSQRVTHFTYSGPEPGYDSVHGVAGSSLIHDEFIVYNPDQVELKYVIDFTPKARRWY